MEFSQIMDEQSLKLLSSSAAIISIGESDRDGRNVKLRLNYQHASPISSSVSQVDFSPVSSFSPEVSNSLNSRYGLPILYQNRLQPMNVLNINVQNGTASIFSPNLVGNRGNGNTGMNFSGLNSGPDCEKKMMDHRLQELEKELLGDEDEGEAVSVVTNNEWSETIQNLIVPTQNGISPSPTSSSSSCSSTSASPPPCTKQSLIDAAAAISEGDSAAAVEIITHLQQVSNPIGTSEQRLTAYMVSALKSRVNPMEHPPPASELYGKEHMLATQMLYDVSPCFKLDNQCMAARVIPNHDCSHSILDSCRRHDPQHPTELRRRTLMKHPIHAQIRHPTTDHREGRHFRLPL
ncbi:hypothetical protein ACS0TY_018908 [Phlomoides rotata]